jgi:hypothetical protein
MHALSRRAAPGAPPAPRSIMQSDRREPPSAASGMAMAMQLDHVRHYFISLPRIASYRTASQRRARGAAAIRFVLRAFVHAHM